jgi:hypothetical protein
MPAKRKLRKNLTIAEPQTLLDAAVDCIILAVCRGSVGMTRGEGWLWLELLAGWGETA